MTLDPRALFPADRLGQITAVTPITIGMSGAKVFAVDTASGQYVLRIHQGEPADWHRSVALYRLAADAGVAPALLHADSASLCTISVKIDATPFGAALEGPDSRQRALRALVSQFATLHAIPPTGLKALNPIALARGLWEQAARPGFPTWATPLGARIEDAATALVRDPRQVFSHCDPNPANMLWDGARVWFVDWEGAGLAHPYLDLAAAANFLSLSDDEAAALLSEQEGAPLVPDDRVTFVALRDLARLIYGALFLSMIPDLTNATFARREETVPLRECFARMGAGKLDMKAVPGLAMIGAAFFAQSSATDR